MEASEAISMFIINNRKIFYFISGALVLASILALTFWGLNLSIDFKGGSIMEVDYAAGRPTFSAIQEALAPLSFDASVRPTGANGYIIRMKDLTEPEHQQVLKALPRDGAGAPAEKRFSSIGPLLGKEAVGKSFWAIALVLICIVLFITFAFRKVSEPVSSWKYGVIAVAALFHDVLIPAGIFSALGHFRGVEVDTLFVTALLVILGFSVHDTIVVFDRTRENLKLSRLFRDKKDFSAIVGESVTQTFTRSINTSLTTLLALVVLYLVGSESTHYFALALILGITVGTYSSIFIASPLLVTVERWQRNRALRK